MGNFFDSLQQHANTRRDTVYSPSVDFASLNETPLTDSKSTTESKPCSEFYLACRNNNVNRARQLLEDMSLDEIDRIEPNGSTALHVACYYGHREIVDLLLKAGADRAINNTFNCLPFDEAKDGRIKELFYRVPNANRLASNTGVIEWESVDNDAVENSAQDRQLIQSIYRNSTGTTSIEKMFQKIENNYINNGLANFDGIDKIKRFFQKATQDQNPIWIIKAYTAETDFYKILNTEIACGATKFQNERRYIIALLSYHPKLDALAFTGCSYRVIQMNFYDLEKYKVNCSLITKSFLSSSIDRKIAELFLCQKESSQKEIIVPKRVKQDGSLTKTWIMCIYYIKHHRTALHIENSSQYANEGEVLIMPYSVFRVRRIAQIKPEYIPKGQTMTEIELEECDQYLDA
ncbi:hypothetical protein I4U23_023123 [Adineta vaga]|nr:hypothetical protein I4U23_023123 [Adineta vaga]